MPIDFVLRAKKFQSTQYLHGLDPATLLPIDLAAPLLNKSPATLRTDITRRPGSLPVFVRFGRRVFFIKKDIDAFIEKSRQVNSLAVTAPAPVRKRGRPARAEQTGKAGGAA